jgi:ABC-type transport system substrate-binding protein
LRVALNNKSPFFLQLTSFGTYFPQQQEFVEKLGDKYAQDGESLLYNGPYTMTAGTAGGGQTVVLEKNDKYWDKDNVAVETINGRIVKENDTAINLYEGGELDLTPWRATRSSSTWTAPTSSGGWSPSRLRAAQPEGAGPRQHQHPQGAHDRLRPGGLTDQILQTAPCPPTGSSHPQ